MVELVTVMIIVGLLAAVGLPRFFNSSSFDTRKFSDEVGASVRYAQKSAVAKQRTICVTITNNTLTLTRSTSNGGTCTEDLGGPDGAASYQIKSPNGITISNASFSFDNQGRPSAAQTITISGDGTRTITVAEESGYVSG